MSIWSDMNEAQRNHFVGELIKAKPLSQCYLAVDWKRVLVTPYTEEQRGKVDAMLVALRASDELWAKFKAGNSEATDDWRAKLAVDVEHWHIRYSDTPGGAWVVVEWLLEQGYEIEIDAAHGRHVHAYASKEGREIHTHGAAMPEVVCQALLRIKAPEALA